MGKHERRRRRLFDADNECHYCEIEMVWQLGYDRTVTIEHLVPRSRGGSNSPHNLVGACWLCNMARGAMDYLEFRDWIKENGRPEFDYLMAKVQRIDHNAAQQA